MSLKTRECSFSSQPQNPHEQNFSRLTQVTEQHLEQGLHVPQLPRK